MEINSLVLSGNLILKTHDVVQLKTAITILAPQAEGVLFPVLESEQHTCERTILNVMNKNCFENQPLL